MLLKPQGTKLQCQTKLFHKISAHVFFLSLYRPLAAVQVAEFSDISSAVCLQLPFI